MVEEFLNHLKYEKVLSAHTIIAYKKDLAQFQEYIKESCGEFCFNNVESSIIRAWIVFLMEEEKVSARSIGRKISALKSFYKYLIQKGFVEKNPMKEVVIPKSSKRLPSFLKEQEMNKFLELDIFSNDFEGVRNRLIVEMLYTAGLRLSELVEMKDSQVDLSANVLRVIGKGNKERLIPFGENLFQLIMCYIELKKTQFGQTAYFFVRSDGRKTYSKMIYRIVKDAISKVSTLSKKSPHVLRHTFATILLNNGAEIEAVKELLGHANLAATEVYTHTTFEQLKDSYKHAHPRAKK